MKRTNKPKVTISRCEDCYRIALSDGWKMTEGIHERIVTIDSDVQSAYMDAKEDAKEMRLTAIPCNDPECEWCNDV